jgi:hypothetical protein
MGRKRKRERLDDQGYYKDAQGDTEARAHGFVPADRKEDKMDKKESKWDHKLSKTDAKTEKAYAKAAKRNALASVLKWLVILIGVVYVIMKTGGLGGSGLLDQAKSFFGGS